MTNLAALMLLKAVSIEETSNGSLTWNQLCRELKLDSCRSAFSNIHKRNSNWPEIVNGEPYDWRIEYKAVFRKHFEARGTASSLKRIRGVLRAKQAKHAATPELERILSFIEKECGSQANSLDSRGPIRCSTTSFATPKAEGRLSALPKGTTPSSTKD